MINKVLVAEDHELANVSVQKTLEELGITDIDYVYYCDDAILKIKNSAISGQPYDLLITDLNFEMDDKPQHIKDGIALIQASRDHLPQLRIIVFSVENKPATIESLFQVQEIDGYVRKSRHDQKELKLALESIKMNQRYFPRHLSQSAGKSNSYQFTEYDVEIITLLANGISSIEKRLNLMKMELGFTKNEQLVAFCKDMGII